MVKHVAKDNGQAIPTDFEKDPAVQAMKIKALEEAVNKLTQVHRTNVEEIRRAFAMVDQHTFVLQRVCNDTAYDLSVVHEPCTEPKLVMTEDMKVDLAWYHHQYYQAQQLQFFVEFFGKLKYTAKTEENEQVSYFGGDYGEAQSAQSG